MRPIVTGATLWLIAAAVPAVAAQGTVEMTPKFSPGKPLTVELRNTSKLPVRLNAASLAFGTGQSPCTVALSGAVSLAPAETKTVTLGTNSAVLGCLNRVGVATRAPRRASVMTAQTAAALSAASPRVTAAAPATLNHPADLSYDLVIGNGTTVSERATWHFAVE
jgi:hypothetical protein